MPPANRRPVGALTATAHIEHRLDLPQGGSRRVHAFP